MASLECLSVKEGIDLEPVDICSKVLHILDYGFNNTPSYHFGSGSSGTQ